MQKVASTFRVLWGTIVGMRVNARFVLRRVGHNQSASPVLYVAHGILFMALAFGPAAVRPQNATDSPFGIAWNVRGTWQIQAAGTLLRSGDSVQPGSLLQPDESASDHSITILLPDGRRILYECFTAEQCARGFRVPMLFRTPDSFAVQLMARIHAALVQQRQPPEGSPRRVMPRDEAVAVLGAGNRIEAGGLAAALEDGHYTYDVRPMDAVRATQSALAVDKKGHSVAMVVPGKGLFRITIADSMKRPRLDLVVEAIGTAQINRVGKSFERVHALLLDWDEDYQGWPIHDFQRAYLESLELRIRPIGTGTTLQPTASHPDAVPEPRFSPLPGIFKGDTEVALQCDMPEAVIHYTVDGSQPFADSPPYRAPIMVKGTELTIKAYAVAPGKKDSPVVTGIFLIEH